MREKLFLDTNVVLDLLGKRDAYYDAIAKIVTLADMGQIQLVVSALTFPTVVYVLSKYESPDVVLDKLRKFKVLTEIADLTDTIIEKSLASGFSDFEDALQYHSAIQVGSDIIITRNHKDFKGAVLPVLSPEEYIKSLDQY